MKARNKNPVRTPHFFRKKNKCLGISSAEHPIFFELISGWGKYRINNEGTRNCDNYTIGIVIASIGTSVNGTVLCSP